MIRALFFAFLLLPFNAGAVTESQVVQTVFTATKSEASFYPTISTFAGVKSATEDWARFTPADLWGAAAVSIDPSSVSQNEVSTVVWSLNGKAQTTYGFYKTRTGADNGMAVLIIPGSGDNQCRQVYQGTGYHGSIVAQTRPYADTYIYCRAGHDFRNLTNGPNRMSDAFIDSVAVAKGTSLDTLWAVEMVAVEAYLEANYSRVVVMGLSQGASFAAVVCLITEPDGCVLSSGFSLMEYDVWQWGTGGGMNIPGLADEWPRADVISAIQAQATEYMISYATNEGVSIWGLEATLGAPTATLMDIGSRLTTVIHAQGHVFPQPGTANFLATVASGP